MGIGVRHHHGRWYGHWLGGVSGRVWELIGKVFFCSRSSDIHMYYRNLIPRAL
ncbi:hypothetical protein GE21DRAFT_1310945 [Neurospora crassa]|nr:hypothetical protein GE21DRAFT_1310945 [Neurospora crassa]